MLWYNCFSFFFCSDFFYQDILMYFYQLILRPEFAFCVFSFIFSVILVNFNIKIPVYGILFTSLAIVCTLQSTTTYFCSKLTPSFIVNLLLLNGWLQFHPWILYVSLSLIIYRFSYLPYYIFSILGVSRFFLTALSATTQLYDYVAVAVCVLALLSGSLWAAQDFSWLGLWNWDNIEITLLFFLLLYVVFVHYSIFSVVLFPILSVISIIVFFFFFFSPGFIEMHISQHNFFNTTLNAVQTTTWSFCEWLTVDTLLNLNYKQMMTSVTSFAIFDCLLPVWPAKLNYGFNWGWFCSVGFFLIYYYVFGLSVVSRHTFLNTHTLLLSSILWIFLFFVFNKHLMFILGWVCVFTFVMFYWGLDLFTFESFAFITLVFFVSPSLFFFLFCWSLFELINMNLTSFKKMSLTEMNLFRVSHFLTIFLLFFVFYFYLELPKLNVINDSLELLYFPELTVFFLSWTESLTTFFFNTFDIAILVAPKNQAFYFFTNDFLTTFLSYLTLDLNKFMSIAKSHGYPTSFFLKKFRLMPEELSFFKENFVIFINQYLLYWAHYTSITSSDFNLTNCSLIQKPSESSSYLSLQLWTWYFFFYFTKLQVYIMQVLTIFARNVGVYSLNLLIFEPRYISFYKNGFTSMQYNKYWLPDIREYHLDMDESYLHWRVVGIYRSISRFTFLTIPYLLLASCLEPLFFFFKHYSYFFNLEAITDQELWVHNINVHFDEDAPLSSLITLVNDLDYYLQFFRNVDNNFTSLTWLYFQEYFLWMLHLDTFANFSFYITKPFQPFSVVNSITIVSTFQKFVAVDEYAYTCSLKPLYYDLATFNTCDAQFMFFTFFMFLHTFLAAAFVCIFIFFFCFRN